MGYLAVWKILEEMIADLRRKGMAVPTEIVSSLKLAKTLIHILKADPNCIDTKRKVEEHLRTVESSIVSEGQKKFGIEYVSKWVKRLDKANQMIEKEDKATRFISGLPRKQKWIRVKPSMELPLNVLKALSDESNLSYLPQKNGCLLVFGEEELIKDFVRKMTAKYKSRTEK